jgi:hypothetical protein
MRIILPLVLGLAFVALVLRHFMRTPAHDLAPQIYMAVGLALMATGVGLLFVRQFAIAIPVGMAGFMLFRRQRAMRSTAGTGQTSSVRGAGLEVWLDHDTGDMDGKVLAGRYAERKLSELTLKELLEIGEDFRDDPKSSRLLEGYLDRAHAGWRDDAQADEGVRKRAAPASGGMDAKEAYEFLGLQPGASDAEVRAAHRRLIKQVHPDRGGSAALAAKINEAKDRILGKHR